ncbi:Transcriptional activator spt7, partial [Mortierella sp. AD094]
MPFPYSDGNAGADDIDVNMETHMMSSPSSSSSEQKEQLLKILNDPSSNSQTRLTYNVAQEMNTRRLWRFYLSEEEHEIFEAALTNLDSWQSFISLDGKFGLQLEEIKRQREQEKQYLQLQANSLENSQSEPVPNIESTEVEDTKDASLESADQLPDIVKVEVADQDEVFSDIESENIKKEDSLSILDSLSVSTPPVSTPNGQLRSLHTPNYAGSPSPRDNRDSQPPNDPSQPETSLSHSPEPISTPTSVPASIPTTAFRSRVMVFEQLLPKLYPSHGRCCHPVVDIQEMESRDPSRHDKVGEILASLNSQGSRTRFVEDDDYDVDMEPGLKQEENSAGSNKGAAPEAPKDEQGQEAKLDNSPLRLPIHHLYYTLEYDMDAMMEQQQLEEADKNIQQEQENQTGSSLVTDNMLTQLGAGSLSMKYLLSAIESNRAATGLTDRELRTLLSDVRPNRSKWANEDKVGQEELYEGCERILMELRNYTEHSTPFLNKVNKREAPDYFQIIKHPMDLGTVLKKLKAFAYQSKTQFANDLYLIYSNCLLYNSDPSSVYRKHAIAMKKRTQQLLETVQDVVIRDRAEVEAEAEESDEEGDSQAGRPNESTKGVGRKEQSSKGLHAANGGSSKNSKGHSSKRGAAAVPLGSETPKMSMDLDTMGNATPTRENSREPSTMDSIETPFLSGGSFERSGLGRSGTPNGALLGSPARYSRMSRASVPVEIDLEQEEKDIAAELNADRGDILFQDWKEKTKKARARICSTRENQQQQRFEDRVALERSPWEMKKSRDIDLAHDSIFDTLAHKKQKKKKTLSFNLDKNGSSAEAVTDEPDPYEDVYGDSDSDDDEENEDDYVRDLFAPPKLKEEKMQKKKTSNGIFLPEYAVRSGLPEVPGLGHERLDDPEVARKFFEESEISAIEEKQPSLSLYPSAIAAPGHLTAGIERNVEELRKIRHIYSKIFAAKATIPEAIQIEEPIEPVPIPPHEGPLPPLIMNSATGNAMLSRVASKLLAHAGFQGAQASALAVMTDITVDFFLNLGRALRGYTDLYNKTMTAEEILLHTLYENGVGSVGELEGYIREDVERYGNKLQDIHRKLETSYSETLNSLNENEVADVDFEYQENDDAFLNGNFIGGSAVGADDLGDDFFGFRELGLGTITIPSRIWFGGQRDGVPNKSGMGGSGLIKAKDPKPALPFPPPPPFKPLTDPTATIGLLQSFFKKRMEDLGSLMEDEFMPVSRRVAMRPKIPPTGKIVSSMKKRSSKPGELSALAEAKKRKRKKEKDAQEAERAERKKQKQDAKDKKILEKLEKKKLKEESKIKEKMAKPTKKGKKATSEGPGEGEGDEDDSDAEPPKSSIPRDSPDPMPPPATIPLSKTVSNSTSSSSSIAVPPTTPKKPKKPKAPVKSATPSAGSSSAPVFVTPPTSMLSSLDSTDAEDMEEEVMESGGGNTVRMLPPKPTPPQTKSGDDTPKPSVAGKTLPGIYATSSSSSAPSSSSKSGVAGKTLPPPMAPISKSKSKSSKD